MLLSERIANVIGELDEIAALPAASAIHGLDKHLAHAASQCEAARKRAVAAEPPPVVVAAGPVPPPGPPPSGPK